jgi:hypothetical protein
LSLDTEIVMAMLPLHDHEAPVTLTARKRPGRGPQGSGVKGEAPNRFDVGFGPGTAIQEEALSTHGLPENVGVSGVEPATKCRQFGVDPSSLNSSGRWW